MEHTLSTNKDNYLDLITSGTYIPAGTNASGQYRPVMPTMTNQDTAGSDRSKLVTTSSGIGELTKKLENLQTTLINELIQFNLIIVIRTFPW